MVQINAAQRLIASSAEQLIRDAVNDARPTLGKAFPLTVKVGSVTRHFMAEITKVPSARDQQRGIKSLVNLMTVHWGKLIKSMDPGWIATYYVLDGRDNLKDSRSYPQQLDENEAKAFWKHFGGMPKH